MTHDLSPRARKILEARQKKGVYPADPTQRWLRKAIIRRPAEIVIPPDLFAMPSSETPQCTGNDRDCFECARIKAMERGQSLSFDAWEAREMVDDD